MHENTARRIAAVQAIVRERYEPGRLDRCFREVWRRHVCPVYPISYRTFVRYVHTDLANERVRMKRAKNPVRVFYDRDLFPDC